MKNCPKCGRFMQKDEWDDEHWVCDKCDMVYCFCGLQCWKDNPEWEEVENKNEQ